MNEEIDKVEVVDNNTQPEKPKKKKKKVVRIIINTLTVILILLFVAEAAIGIINMQRISNKEEPVWYLSTSKKETSSETVTNYNLGLYRIVKTDSSKETKITLKPFFIKE